ncbi:MAG TPA: IclR family transcriptional regulator [Thermoleophilia bacterium]|nr:IclR family transcriptional regulator [Thermoleophilia bacterium]
MAAESKEPERVATYQVRVLDRAIDILDSFTLRRKELSIPEIVEATGLNRSTAIRLVTNLERRGLLQPASKKGRYRLGQRLFEMGSIVHSSFSLLEAAAGPLSTLERQSSATILLAIRNGEYSVIVDKRQGVGDGSRMVPMPVEVGNVRPLTYGLIGQVILASLTPEAVDDLLEKYPLEQHTPYSTKDRDRFLERLPLIRCEGYGIEVNEAVEGLMGLAAPVLDFAGDTAGVLALGFPATREKDRAFIDATISNLKRTAAEVSANMGHVSNPDAMAASEEGVDQAAEGPASSCHPLGKIDHAVGETPFIVVPGNNLGTTAHDHGEFGVED